jgi:hypothetical protein
VVGCRFEEGVGGAGCEMGWEGVERYVESTRSALYR